MNNAERFAQRLIKSQSGFLYRVSGDQDPVRTCEAMRDLLRKIRIEFSFMRVNGETEKLLQDAIALTEQAFAGEDPPELWQKFCDLGSVLMGAGKDELGVACRYLHITFGNLRPSQWPTTRAQKSEQADLLKSLVPILHSGFEDVEVTTAKHLKSV